MPFLESVYFIHANNYLEYPFFHIKKCMIMIHVSSSPPTTMHAFILRRKNALYEGMHGDLERR
jgi:hypothetical protein